MGCSVCEDPGKLDQTAGELLLAPALGHTFGRVNRLLQSAAMEGEFRGREDGVLKLALNEGELAPALRRIGTELTGAEAAGCRAVFLRPDETFGVHALARMYPLATLLARAENGWLSDVLAEGRLTAHFQPIVLAQAQHEVYAYESLLRGIDKDGALIRPDRLFDAARAAELLFNLDRAARITAIREASRHGLETPIFINFNPTSIYDPSYCLRTTFEAAETVGVAPANFVFEVVESDRVNDPEHLLGILREYRSNGFRVALDDLGAGYGSLNLLQTLQPDFVKIDRQLVSGVDGDASRQAILRNLAGMSRELGIAMIAEGVETAGEAEWLAAAGVDYLQGFYFARPASPPPAVTPG